MVDGAPAPVSEREIDVQMSDNRVEKEHGPLDQVKEVTGVYGLGFERESVIGFALPFAIVVGIGGILGVIIWQFL